MEEFSWSHAVIKRHESFSLDGKDVCGMDGMDNVLGVDVRGEIARERLCSYEDTVLVGSVPDVSYSKP